MYKKKMEKAVRLIKNNTKNMAFDFIQAFFGDPVSAAKTVYEVLLTAVSIKDMIFWDKVERFLREIHITSAEKETLQRLFAEPDKEENIKRLIQCIDNIESERTIDFLAKATRALINDDINKLTYFRICYVLEHTLYEDLCFLQQHFDEENIEYTFNVQGLLSSGLMYTSIINDDDNAQRYSFTPLAAEILNNAVLYNEERDSRDLINIKKPVINVRINMITSDEMKPLLNSLNNNSEI